MAEDVPAAGGEPELLMKEKLVIKKSELAMQMETLILKTKPYTLYRWLAWGALAIIFLLRLSIGHRFYTIGYIAGIYCLNCLVLFVSPKLDPELYGRDVLPTATDDDYRPFVRKLPEFVFWQRLMTCAVIAHIATLLPFLDPPVYGPLLLVYLLFVVVLTFRARIAHMIRNGYVPFDWGKPRVKPADK